MELPDRGKICHLATVGHAIDRMNNIAEFGDRLPPLSFHDPTANVSRLISTEKQLS